MLLTEDEAKRKWCPQRRDACADNGAVAGNNENATCIAAECMMWREETEVRIKGGVGRIYGWCGMAGTPPKASEG